MRARPRPMALSHAARLQQAEAWVGVRCRLLMALAVLAVILVCAALVVTTPL